MMGRGLLEIDADIALAQQRVARLQLERETVRRTEIDDVVSRFDGGASPKQIARDLTMPRSAINGILYRAGRSLKGRTAIKHQVRVAVSAGMAS